MKSLILNDCNLSDIDFSEILEGIQTQGNYLQQLVYVNNYLGLKSINSLKQILPNIIDLQISNIKGGICSKDMLELINTIDDKGTRIMKLKLSNVNLNY